MTLLLAEHGGIYNIPANRFKKKNKKMLEILKDSDSDASFVLKLMLGDDINYAVGNTQEN